MRRALQAAIVLLLPLAARAAPAQDAADRLARGIRAYRDLDFDSAASYLRTALGPGSGAAPALADADRARALVYLGATELFREHRDTALAVFRRLVVLDPRYRPDQLIFPPEVVGLFEQARLGTPAIAAALPPITEITAGVRLAARLYASTYHMVTVTVARRAGGQRVRTLYAGAIGDSLEVLWDGRDTAGTTVDSGAFVLRVVSRGTQAGGPSRTLDVPLDVQRTASDTLPLPEPPLRSQLRPETTPRSGSVRPLAAGLIAAATTIALPSLVAPGTDPSAARLGVGVAIGALGIVGFVAQRRPAPIPENVAANRELRLAWERRRAAAVAENERLRREARLVVRAGRPTTGDTR